MGKEKIAVYPGTFDPITNGHIDIIIRAAKLFDRIIVAVGENPQKSPTFTHTERVDMVKKVVDSLGLPNVEVDHFCGLLAEYASRKGVTAIIRGLRAVSDFEYEFQMALANRKLFPRAETVFLMPSQSFVYLSSSIVKIIAQNGGDVSQFVPKEVEEMLMKKFGGKS